MKTVYMIQTKSFGLVMALFCMVFLTQCKAPQKPMAYSKAGISGFPENCIEGETNTKDTLSGPGPVKLYFYIDTISINGSAYPIQQDITFEVDKESELMVFNDSFAFKFFHIQSREYGKWKHSVRLDFLGKGKSCWKILASMSYFELSRQFTGNTGKEDVKRNISSFSSSRQSGEARTAVGLKYAIGAFR